MLAPTTSIGAFEPSVRNAIGQLQQADSRYEHVILTTAEGSTSRAAPFQLVSIAAGGLDALRTKLQSRETRFALLRVQTRVLLIVSLGQGITGLKRAHVLVQGRALQSSLGAILFAALTIASTSQLTPALVSSKLQLEGFAHVPSPDLNQDFRASWASASTSAASIVSRAKPSAPSSPEDVGHDASWARPVSDIGPLHHSDAAQSISVGSRAKSVLVTRSASPSSQGIVIDLASVIDGTAQPTPPFTSQDKFPLLPAADFGKKEPFLSSPVSLDASLATPRSATPSDPGSPHWPRSPRVRLSADERKRLSDERDRLRADEAIRDQVMKKLRAEQQTSLRSPTARTPRLAVVPPLAPPPPFAPPPPPSSDAMLVASTRRPSSIASPRAASKQKLDGESSPTTAPTVTVSGSCGSKPVDASGELQALQRQFDERPRSSESHESIRSSIQSLNLWEFAEAASRQDSFLHLPRRASPSMPSTTRRSFSGSGTPSHVRSRQGSGSESVVSGENQPCTTSSSRGSVAASSLFDKELPALPSDFDYGSNGGDEWIGDLEVHDSPRYVSPASMLPGKKERERQAENVEEAELHDLRERLAQAEARAKAAEDAAELAVREVQIETRRLAEELAKVERGTREKMEAEAIRRAKWAREQVARDQLDAYERSKLEADEKRRRRAIEEQRRLECDRAARIREEQEWRQHEADRIKQEYELRIQLLAEREAKLKAQAEERERREQERAEHARASEAFRQQRLEELTKAVQGSEVILSGWLNLHSDEAVQWRRRWYEVVDRQLVLCKSATDRSAMTVIPLTPGKLISVTDEEEHDGCLMRYGLRFEVQGSSTVTHTYTVSTDTHAAKLDLSLVVEAVAASVEV
ncbi:hypothetical protein EX895_006096 [Sporisorium graminicola]|uniref:PH domain-containing protein n=1 Tax=Sporisorium graminicola TaxID=280036 RepID=A0A4U7KMC8_9BASI|nr:hypothetical protein EX895_006096 [Sporisorium graminicola]TKY85016.1 hypothetical protein EX895_006096 [Sporisorium graminicola]